MISLKKHVNIKQNAFNQIDGTLLNRKNDNLQLISSKLDTSDANRLALVITYNKFVEQRASF